MYCCSSLGSHHPLFCILPPYILRNIAQNGSPEQRKAALHSLETAQSVWLGRKQLPPPAQPRVALATPATPRKRRSIRNANHTESLTGKIVRKEGGVPTGDLAVDEAYDGLGATFDFYWQMYERNSIDNDGMPLDAIVHYGQNFDNAFWDGERMIFGDGDGELFNRFTISLDVIGHELAHGVTQFEAQLVYSRQSGALNEHISDVFGSLIKQHKLGKQTAKQADWLIGAGLFTDKVNGVALRSMKVPGTAFDDEVLGKDPQPAHMDKYVNTISDNGGVHLNSGIPNRAFYLVATGIGGFAGDKAGKIWYTTLRDDKLKPRASFRQFAQLTVDNAWKLYPESTEQAIVKDAWKQVGVTVK